MMRQLEKALLDLTERAEPLPLDVLLHRVETQIALEDGRPAITDGHAATDPVPASSRHRRPPLRRRQAWAFAAAFVLTIAAIGIAALALRGDTVPPADDKPATPPTTAIPEVTTTAQSVAEVPPTDSYGGWEWRTIDEPWTTSVIDAAALPNGGFVIAATDQWSVLWSPNGLDWRDADPQREVTVLSLTRGFMGSRPQVVTTIADRTVVLDNDLIGIKIGDLESQMWDSIEFDASDLAGNVGLLIVASNDTHVLAIGYEDDYAGGPLRDDGGRVVECGEIAGPMAEVAYTRYFAWLVDPRSGEVQRSTVRVSHDSDGDSWARVLAGARACGRPYGSLAWFKDQWVLNLDGVWLVSSDGTSWALNPKRSPTSDFSSATLIAGPDTLLAEVWNGLWYSDNGSDWYEVPESEETRRGPSEAAYSASFGYVATPWSDPGLYVSADGRNWQYAGYWPDVGDLTASGDRIFGGDYLFIFSGQFDPPDSSVVVELPERGEILLDQDDEFVANVGVGDMFTVSLPGYPPAGSGWAILEPPNLCRLLEDPSFEQREGGAEWEGTYRFTFEALQVGSGELVFEYHSPDDEGADIFSLDVDIHASEDE